MREGVVLLEPPYTCTHSESQHCNLFVFVSHFRDNDFQCYLWPVRERESEAEDRSAAGNIKSRRIQDIESKEEELVRIMSIIIVHSRSVDPWKLRVGVKYYTVHMYSMPYYTYGSTANFLFLEPTALIYIYIYQKNMDSAHA